MIQLYINGKLCDIDEDIDIQLEKEFDKSDEHIIEESEYSFEIEIPISDRNREAFGFVDVFDVTAKFNQSYDAALNVDEVNILNGKFLLEEISDEYYSGNLYVPARKSLKDVLGDKKMSEIKAHPINISDWKTISKMQWKNIMGTSDRDPHVVFPYVLYRLPYNIKESTYPITTQDLAASGNTFSTENIFPAFNVLSVLKDVFDGEGYSLQGNIFGMKKFTELYQTFCYDQSKYKSEKVVPYYLDFSAEYLLANLGNTSSTAREVELFGDPSMRWGTDALLISENTSIVKNSDDYGMLTQGKSGAWALTIPKSGWYQIYCTVKTDFPNYNDSFSRDNRITVCGKYNDSDRVDLSQNILEFQIKKTSTPMSTSQLYSYNCCVPMIPTDMSKENLHTEGFFSSNRHHGIKLSYDDARNKFAKNHLTALVKDYSGYDTSEFIAGARWGSQFSSTVYSSDNLEDRRSIEMIFTSLPNPTKAYMERQTVDGKEIMFMPMYSVNGLKKGNSNEYRYDYGSDTAQVLVRDDSFSNFEGYNKFTPAQEGNGGTWDMTSNFGRYTYAGQYSNYASTEPGGDGSMCVGNAIIRTCVWLEEGDNLSLEMMMPYNDYADECGWLETCDWKHYYKSGTVNTSVKTRMIIGLASTDKKWIPTIEMPIPDVEDFDRFIRQQNNALTNVNKFLGDTKVNDYIENFLNTFNLKLTRVNNTTYDISTFASESKTKGNIIDIDEWANVKDAEFHRIDMKNTTLEWTISTDEEGYVHGNTTREEKTAREESGYTGGITFENQSSNDEEKIKSNWSYTWMKDITFVNGDVSYPSGVREVPVIGDSDIWENNYLTVQNENYATDKTSRLIYLDRNPQTNTIDYFNVLAYKEGTTLPEIKCPLLFCKNYINYKTSLNTTTTFRLDYNNSLSTDTDETITDVFFNIKKGAEYEIDLPVTLPNEIYAKIKANTLVKFNDGLFRVMGIEGHNVNMAGEATLKLITLK